MVNHQAAGPYPPIAATLARALSAIQRTGLELAMVMMTTTKIGSAVLTLAPKVIRVDHPFIKTMVRNRGISQTPKTTSTSPMKPQAWALN